MPPEEGAGEKSQKESAKFHSPLEGLASRGESQTMRLGCKPETESVGGQATDKNLPPPNRPSPRLGLFDSPSRGELI